MSIYFILIFAVAGFYYIIKSVNLPDNRHRCQFFADLSLDEAALSKYTRTVSLYYLLTGILLIIFPFIYQVMGTFASLLLGTIFVISFAFTMNKRHKLMTMTK